VTRDDVERVVRREYAPEQRDTVIALLEEYGAVDQPQWSRVALAILKLSGGDVEQVRYHLKLAKMDFRDVLIPAEYRRGSEGSSAHTPEEYAAAEQRVADDWREYQEWLHKE
jgi:hypothetical protein